MKRVTAASNETVQEGYLYFFANLKMSEYKMLEGVCTPDLGTATKESFLAEAVDYLVGALLARRLDDCMDLHYIASAQMSQVC